MVTAQTKSGTNHFPWQRFLTTAKAMRIRRLTLIPSSSSAGATNNDNLVPGGLRNQIGGSVAGQSSRIRYSFSETIRAAASEGGNLGYQTVPTTMLMNTCLGRQVGPSGIPGCDFSQYAAASWRPTALSTTPMAHPIRVT